MNRSSRALCMIAILAFVAVVSGALSVLSYVRGSASWHWEPTPDFAIEHTTLGYWRLEWKAPNPYLGIRDLELARGVLYTSLFRGQLDWWIPLNVVAGVCGAGAVLVYVHPLIRMARRRRRGECAYCGYNLTGNMSWVCPECGGPVPRSQPVVCCH
jgi:hypothetical protein